MPTTCPQQNKAMDKELKQVRIIGVSEDTAELLDIKRELNRFYDHFTRWDARIYSSAHEDEVSKLFVKMNDVITDLLGVQVDMNSSESNYQLI